MMLFCPKCGSLLRPKVDGKKRKMFCSCGYSTSDLSGVVPMKETAKHNNPAVAVVEQEHEAYPLVDADCPVCHHKKAYFWAIQTRAADEPETKFFKCEKCKHTWRDYI